MKCEDLQKLRRVDRFLSQGWFHKLEKIFSMIFANETYHMGNEKYKNKEIKHVLAHLSNRALVPPHMLRLKEYHRLLW